MKPARHENSVSSRTGEGADFHGASIITSTGKEIPITEQMLERTFNVLIDAWEKTHGPKKS